MKTKPYFSGFCLGISLILLCSLSAAQPLTTSTRAFLIRVVDQATSRPVPLVQLTAPMGIDIYTDSAGLATFSEPALMNRNVYFEVFSHGYHIIPDGLGSKGRVLRTTPGAESMIVIERDNIAQRLYRITGAGIYTDTVSAGFPAPIREPLLNCGVLGQDSVLSAQYKDRLFWIWGDTSSSGHPLSSNYRATGAWVDLPGSGGLDPDIGVNVEYFSENGFVQPLTRMDPKGVYWLSCLAVSRDAQNKEHLMARYDKIRPPMTSIERGLMEFDDKENSFVRLRTDSPDAIIQPSGHAMQVTKGSNEWIYFGTGTAYSRAPAKYEDLIATGALEAYTCLREGERFTTTGVNVVDRDSSDSKVRFSWKKNTSPVGYSEQEALVKAGILKPEERMFAFQDTDNGETLLHHSTTLAWNPWRKRWTKIVSELFGSSVLGELWYAEADYPEGPWIYAQKIITHDTYTMYNPLQHPELAKDNGRVIYFEGTYTESFSGAKTPTPRYDYNQIMYKLELDDPRVAMPVPVYRNEDLTFRIGGVDRDTTEVPDLEKIAFFAPDQPRAGCIGIAMTDAESTSSWKLTAATTDTKPLFYAVDAKTTLTNTALVPLVEIEEPATGRRTWITGTTIPLEWKQISPPLCYVWNNPAAAPPESYVEWGEAAGGLQISFTPIQKVYARSDPWIFTLKVANIGNSDVSAKVGELVLYCESSDGSSTVLFTVENNRPKVVDGAELLRHIQRQRQPIKIPAHSKTLLKIIPLENAIPSDGKKTFGNDGVYSIQAEIHSSDTQRESDSRAVNDWISVKSRSTSFEIKGDPNVRLPIYVNKLNWFEHTTLTLLQNGRFFQEMFSDLGGNRPVNKGAFTETSDTITLLFDGNYFEPSHEMTYTKTPLKHWHILKRADRNTTDVSVGMRTLYPPEAEKDIVSSATSARRRRPDLGIRIEDARPTQTLRRR